jgi:hypothetical protein
MLTSENSYMIDNQAFTGHALHTLFFISVFKWLSMFYALHIGL